MLRSNRLRLCCVTALLAGLSAGCQSGGTAQRRQLSAVSPLDRAKAVVRLAEAGDRDAVHKLVDLLEDPNHAVRMYTILALRRLCGEDYGYQYYAAEAERTRAVRRWRDALRRGDVAVRPKRQGAAIPEPAPDNVAGAGSASPHTMVVTTP